MGGVVPQCRVHGGKRDAVQRPRVGSCSLAGMDKERLVRRQQVKFRNKRGNLSGQERAHGRNLKAKPGNFILSLFLPGMRLRRAGKPRGFPCGEIVDLFSKERQRLLAGKGGQWAFRTPEPRSHGRASGLSLLEQCRCGLIGDALPARFDQHVCGQNPNRADAEKKDDQRRVRMVSGATGMFASAHGVSSCISRFSAALQGSLAAFKESLPSRQAGTY